MTTNEMIWKTLTTKITKEPKFRLALANIGIEIYDSGNSEQDFWAVKDTITGRNLVVSKDYGNRRGLYGNDGYWKIETRDMRVIDYIGYLKCSRGYKTYYDLNPVESEYKVLRNLIITKKERRAYWKRQVQTVDAEIDKLETDKRKYLCYYESCDEDIRKARERVDELKQARNM